MVGAPWPPEAFFGIFVPLVYSVQGEAVEQGRVLLVWVHLDEFPFSVFVGLLEDRED